MGGGGGGGAGFAGGLTRVVGFGAAGGVFPGVVFPDGDLAGGALAGVAGAGALVTPGAVFPAGFLVVWVCPEAVPATSTSASVHPSSSNDGAEGRSFCRLRARVDLCRIMAGRCIARRRPERERYDGDLCEASNVDGTFGW